MENINSKPKLIILSDLWGREKSGWTDSYVERLQNNYSITCYDCCELGGIDKTSYTEPDLHHQFINGGIERAVINLLANEKEEVSVLAFSIGGVIAWKATLLGLKVKSLFAVSSTRLRYETEKPAGRIELYFGENDVHRPSIDWFRTMKISSHTLRNESHELYRKLEYAQMLSEDILKPGVIPKE